MAVVARAQNYLKRYGVRAAFARAMQGMQRTLFAGRMALFFCDLESYALIDAGRETDTRVERRKSADEIAPEELTSLIGGWDADSMLELIRERFARGSILWLAKKNGQTAGYGWTIIGATIEPHYFPLGSNDAHLFDFFVLPKYRGLGINPLLVKHILGQLAAEQRRRAFIEAAEWNAPQLTSLKKTPFKPLGRARMMRILGKHVVIWSK